MRGPLLAAIAVLLALPAWAQQVPNPMAKDGANAQLPQALQNLSANANAATYYAQAYGSCTWDATGDIGPCVNLAIDAATAAGGGTVKLPRGSFGLSTTIRQLGDVDGKAVTVEGAGGQGGGLRCNTTLTWRGTAGATMVDYDAGITKRLYTPGLKGVCLLGAPDPFTVGTGANVGFRMIGVERPLVDDVYVRGVQTDGIFIDANQSTAGGSGRGKLDNVLIQVGGDANSLNAHCFTIGRTVDASLYNNDTFGFVMNNIWCGHKNGHGFNIGAADHNYCYGCTADTLPGGTGKSLIFRSRVSNSFPTQDNYFQGAFGAGGGGGGGRITCEDGSHHNTVHYVVGGGQLPPEPLGTGTCIGISSRGDYVDNSDGKTQRLALAKIAVGSLPTCNAAAEGMLYAVTDANSAVFNAAVASGGANKVMAYCDGTGWKVH